jgi:hypothetical protein
MPQVARRAEPTSKLGEVEVSCYQSLRVRTAQLWGSNSDLERRRRNHEQMRLNRLREVWRSLR